MTLRITIFAALSLLAGNASADFFDGFDMGNFFGNNRQEQSHQASTTGQTHSNGASNANGRSRGRGAADINMDFDLNFRAKADSMFNADGRGQSRGDVTQYQTSQLGAYGSGYNNAYNYLNTTPYSYAYPYQYSYYYTPYTQGYYYPQYYPQAYYLPPAQ